MPLRQGSRQVLLDAAHLRNATMVRFINPTRVIESYTPADVTAALGEIGRAVRAGFHVAGYISYELGYALEHRLIPYMPHRCDVPLLWFGTFDKCEEIDVNDKADVLGTRNRAYAGPLRHDWDETDYRKRFVCAHSLMTDGDIYQVNLTFRSRFTCVGDPFALYCNLRDKAQARHCAYVDDGVRQILSLSPELFFELSPSGVVTARPMKGTAAREIEPQSDAAARAALAASEKNRAENLMIVDLMRNDLGRIAEVGSVKVDELFAIETYPTLHQMVSTVSAKLEPGNSVNDVVWALFPCGSVTGAPKIRAIEVISELESSARGVYCGSIGYFAPDGSARFNVAIRTITIEGGRGELGIGGAVTYDSDASSEYAECLLKALYYERDRRPIELIETLRHSPQIGFVRLDRHLARMARSAETFGIPFDESLVRRSLSQAVDGSERDSRVRLTLDEDGSCSCSVTLAEKPPENWVFAVSPHRTNSNDLLLRHKTNWRELYDTELRRAAAAYGVDEVVFLNEREELTEGSRTNLFIERNGRLLTPALACGLLDGCLRQSLLDEGRCSEATLNLPDLLSAETVYLGNSLRGMIRAKLGSARSFV